MADRKTSWSDTNRLNPFRPKVGQISSDKKHVWNGKKWVKYIGPPKKVKVSAAEFFGTNQYGSGGSKETERSKLQGKSNNNNNKKGSSSASSGKSAISWKQYVKATAKGTGLKVINGKVYNLKNREELTAYNKALKASKSGKTDEPSNRDKISANNKGGKKGNNFKTTVHTRHYKTGERLGVMTRSQRRAYEKEAGDKTFGQRVADHEKESGHGKPHLRETKYKASVRKGKTTNGSNNRKNLTIKEQHQIKLNEQQQTTAKQMQGDPRYQGPPFKKKKR